MSIPKEINHTENRLFREEEDYLNKNYSKINTKIIIITIKN